MSSRNESVAMSQMIRHNIQTCKQWTFFVYRVCSDDIQMIRTSTQITVDLFWLVGWLVGCRCYSNIVLLPTWRQALRVVTSFISSWWRVRRRSRGNITTVNLRSCGFENGVSSSEQRTETDCKRLVTNDLSGCKHGKLFCCMGFYMHDFRANFTFLSNFNSPYRSSVDLYFKRAFLM